MGFTKQDVLLNRISNISKSNNVKKSRTPARRTRTQILVRIFIFQQRRDLAHRPWQLHELVDRLHEINQTIQQSNDQTLGEFRTEIKEIEAITGIDKIKTLGWTFNEDKKKNNSRNRRSAWIEVREIGRLWDSKNQEVLGEKKIEMSMKKPLN